VGRSRQRQEAPHLAARLPLEVVDDADLDGRARQAHPRQPDRDRAAGGGRVGLEIPVT
jgi:hypothetical protein